MANIKLNNNEYPIPDSTLAATTADFIAHLQTIAGEGLRVVVGGVEYNVDPNKVASAVADLEAVLGGLNVGGGENNEYRVIMPETTMADFSQEDGAYITWIDFVPEVGNEYLIKYNGNTYNCVARRGQDDLPPVIKQEICLGNAMVFNDPTIYGDDDTGEPFFITVLDFIDDAPKWYFYSLNDNPCTISISEKLPSSSV